MGSFSIWHIIVVVVLIVLLFGRGKVSELMGDVAKGIKNFRQGMADDPRNEIPPPEEKPLAERSKADATKV